MASEELKEGVVDYFETHFRNVRWKRPPLNDLALSKLSPLERDSLEDSFNKEEMWSALESCDGYKALGPDGFNLKFLKDNWDFIQDDFMKFMGEFYHNGELLKS